LINVPVGLPAIPVPSDNPLTRQKIELGKRLFFERRLSENEGISCASCHIPDKAFADGTVISPGPKGPSGTRNTPTLVNVSLQPYQLWDGRSSSLEDQALLPVENPREMGSRLETVLDRLNQVASYRTAFQEVFGTLATRNTVAQALASFERTILSGNSAYDRYRAGDREAMRPASIEGMKLFHGKAHCSVCHRGPNLSNGQFHNLGVGWNGSRFADQGRFAVTGIIKDKGAFKTPTLRQVAQTAPYMHDGSLATLDEVVEFYNRGGNPNPHLDPLIQPRKLNAQEKRWLVEFLKSLTGDITLY
jgi:cytochrome c peroxidase